MMTRMTKLITAVVAIFFATHILAQIPAPAHSESIKQDEVEKDQKKKDHKDNNDPTSIEK